MKLWVQSLAWLSGLRIRRFGSCGGGCRRGSDPKLLWLWLRPAATAPVRPLAWEPPYAAGVALKKKSTKVHKSCFVQQLFFESSVCWTLHQEGFFFFLKNIPSLEFLLWCNGISGISAAPGCRFSPCLAQWVKVTGVATAVV